jgi:hypothetical protein
MILIKGKLVKLTKKILIRKIIVTNPIRIIEAKKKLNLVKSILT